MLNQCFCGFVIFIAWTEILIEAPTVDAIDTKPHTSVSVEKVSVKEPEEIRSDAGAGKDSAKISPTIGKTETDVSNAHAPLVEKGDVSEKEKAKKQEEKRVNTAATKGPEKISPVKEKGNFFFNTKYPRLSGQPTLY